MKEEKGSASGLQRNMFFYSKYVKQPTATAPLPAKLEASPKFSPFLSNAIVSIDGVHTLVSPPESERA